MSTARTETMFVIFVEPIEVPRDMPIEQKIAYSVDIAMRNLTNDRMPMAEVYNEDSEKFDATLGREYHFTPITLKARAHIIKDNRVEIIGTRNKED